MTTLFLLLDKLRMTAYLIGGDTIKKASKRL
jgi:hypothetical protein